LEEIKNLVHLGRLVTRENTPISQIRSVAISLWLVLRYEGEPRGLEEQALLWVPAAELPHHDLLEADLPLLPVLCAALGV
jgi:hypothetical protein